jgi:hypothetical protein
MIAGNAEFPGNLVRREAPIRLSRQPHQSAQAEIGKGRELHGNGPKCIGNQSIAW